MRRHTASQHFPNCPDGSRPPTYNSQNCPCALLSSARRPRLDLTVSRSLPKVPFREDNLLYLTQVLSMSAPNEVTGRYPPSSASSGMDAAAQNIDEGRPAVQFPWNGAGRWSQFPARPQDINGSANPFLALTGAPGYNESGVLRRASVEDQTSSSPVMERYFAELPVPYGWRDEDVFDDEDMDGFPEPPTTPSGYFLPLDPKVRAPSTNRKANMGSSRKTRSSATLSGMGSSEEGLWGGGNNALVGVGEWANEELPPVDDMDMDMGPWEDEYFY